MWGETSAILSDLLDFHLENFDSVVTIVGYGYQALDNFMLVHASYAQFYMNRTVTQF